MIERPHTGLEKDCRRTARLSPSAQTPLSDTPTLAIGAEFGSDRDLITEDDRVAAARSRSAGCVRACESVTIGVDNGLHDKRAIHRHAIDGRGPGESNVIASIPAVCRMGNFD